MQFIQFSHYFFVKYQYWKTKFYIGTENITQVSSEWANLMNSGMSELKGDHQCCANHGLSLVIKASKEGAEVR